MRDDIFAEVKSRVTMQDAINYLRLGEPTERNGDQFRWGCPKCGGGSDNRTLSVNLVKGYGCFVGATGKEPKSKGDDCIALVAHVENVRNGEAARRLKDHFRDRFVSAARASSSTEPRPATAEAKGRPGDSGAGVRPLDFHDWEHPVMDLLKISPGLLREIGGGIDHTDLLDERICVPLRKESGELRGYLAIATKPEQTPLIVVWLVDEMEVNISPEKRSQDEMRKLLRVV